jgi:hypothetical protein
MNTRLKVVFAIALAAARAAWKNTGNGQWCNSRKGGIPMDELWYP